MIRNVVLVLLLPLLIGCGVTWWPFGGRSSAAPDLAEGLREVSAEQVVAFYGRTDAFYGHLAGRRFNTLASYEDEFVREFFQTDRKHADYYANLAQALRQAFFERNRPMKLEVLEIRVVGPGDAIVETRIVGEDSRPLRFWSTTLIQEDRWERSDGTWWIVPGPI
jgi:hypothetical protein